MGWWSRLKRTVKRVVKAVVSAVIEVVSRILRIVTIVLTYLGILDVKTVRLRVLVLRRSDHQPLATVAEVLPVIERARDILLGSANIRLVPTSGNFVWTINEFGSAVPPEALHLRGPDPGAVWNQLGIAGEFFDEMIDKYHSDATFPFNLPTIPITCFIVAEIDGARGIASPIAGNWFAVRAPGLAPEPGIDTGSLIYPSIMAHELGHCMGLLTHSDDPFNLMYAPDSRGETLTQGQLVVARSARCVSFW